MIRKTLQVLVISIVTALAPSWTYGKSVEENPSGYAMMGDLVVARPLGVVLLGVTSVFYVATLPFSLLGGNAKEAGKALVIEPAKEALIRCLGCERPGRKEKISSR